MVKNEQINYKKDNNLFSNDFHMIDFNWHKDS